MPHGPQKKKCPNCGRLKPLTAEFWYRQTRAASGFQTYCKSCMAGWNKSHYDATSTRPKRTKMPVEERRSRQRQFRRLERIKDAARVRLRETRSHLKRLYGISVEQYEEIFVAQGNACAICRATEERHRRFWHVDHCHDTKRIRGILCAACNLMLGYSRDNPTILRSAIQYLKETDR